eukprot:scaffold8276_cov62-Phaeocystis_antarctica.AAC.7
MVAVHPAATGLVLRRERAHVLALHCLPAGARATPVAYSPVARALLLLGVPAALMRWTGGESERVSRRGRRVLGCCRPESMRLAARTAQANASCWRLRQTLNRTARCMYGWRADTLLLSLRETPFGPSIFRVAYFGAVPPHQTLLILRFCGCHAACNWSALGPGSNALAKHEDEE